MHLFALILDVQVESDDGEVDIALELWNGARQSALDEVVADPVLGSIVIEHCRAHGSEARGGLGGLQSDADGQVRAWMSVVTYLMLQPEMVQR